MSRILSQMRRSEPEDNRGPSLGFNAWRGRPRAMGGTHSHTDLEWNYLSKGSMRYFLAGRFRTIPAGRLAVFWAGAPHQLTEVEASCECLWVTVPLAWFLDWGLAPAAVERLLRGELLVEPDGSAGAAAAEERLLGRWVDDLASGDADLRRIALLEVESRLRRLVRAVASLPGAAASASARDDLRPVERAAEHIGEHYTENDLSVEAVAGAVGLHPNYLMTLFKRHCGMTLWEYVTRLRVSRAQRRLLTSGDKVLAVALESGFGSASRFYEAFRRYGGGSPRAYRRARKSSDGKR
jgi:AraC family transcriptional regulator, melibiose operon regulatory protein